MVYLLLTLELLQQPKLNIQNLDLTSDDVAKVKSIFYLSEFPSSNIKYYQASLVAVEPMEPKSMFSGLERLNNGEQFEDVFNELF